MVLIPWIVVELGPIVGWFVLYGARKSWLYFTSAIARIFVKHHFSWRNLVLPVVGIGSAQVNTAVQQSHDDLGKGVQESEPTASGWIIGLAAALEYHAFTVKYLAAATLAALESIGTVAIPRGAKTQTGTTRAVAEAANARSWQALRDALRAERDALRAVRIAQHAGAISIPRPAERPAIRAKEQADAISRWFSRWRKWIIGGLGAAAFTGVVLRVLTRELPWFKCANVNKTARQICRMPTRLLDDLLSLGADFFVLTNICRVIPWLESAFGEVAVPLIDTLTRIDAGLCQGGAGRAPALSVPALHLPPVTGVGAHLDV